MEVDADLHADHLGRVWLELPADAMALVPGDRLEVEIDGVLRAPAIVVAGKRDVLTAVIVIDVAIDVDRVETVNIRRWRAAPVVEVAP